MSRKESDLTFDAEERAAVVHSMLGNAMPPCATPEQMDHREEGSELGRSARGLLDYITGVEAWARAAEGEKIAQAIRKQRDAWLDEYDRAPDMTIGPGLVVAIFNKCAGVVRTCSTSEGLGSQVRTRGRELGLLGSTVNAPARRPESSGEQR